MTMSRRIDRTVARRWRETISDLISRQAAIEAVTMEGCGMCAECIKDIPAALLEREPGKWTIEYLPKRKMEYCSMCGFGKYIDDERKYRDRKSVV